MEITQTQNQMRTRRPFLRLTADSFKSFLSFLVRRAGSNRKRLSVRETAALGDRRFVSVIQFERQRFLIGSSSSSISLLAQLPDESTGGEGTAEENRITSGETN
jgi:flagellar biogenesis protein FliO